MTCRILDQDNTTTKGKNIKSKRGLKRKRKTSRRTCRNTLYYRNCSQQKHISKPMDNESTHLVETEFKILQSLIPGISDQHEISEVSLDVNLY